MPPLPPSRPSPCTEVSEVTMRERTQPTIAPEAIVAALSQITDPDLGRDIVTLGFVKDLKIDGENVSFAIELTTPACPVRDQMKEDAQRTVLSIPGVTHVAVVMSSKVRGSQSGQKDELIPLVKNVVPVASGKGGVGKSTVSANLAVALAKLGAKVGLMDADVYGPSIPTIMGATTPLTTQNGAIVPVLRYGVGIVSMGFFVPRGEATIWRGPMLSKMIDKFLGGVDWGELDYLLIDLPPGTGDVQLSLCQRIPLSGAAVVSTPQDLAFNVAEKAISMFTKLRTPVLGLIENMSGFECRHCGQREEIFGSGGARDPLPGRDPSLDGHPHDLGRGQPDRPVPAPVAERPRLPSGRREPRGPGQHPQHGWSLRRSTADRRDYAAIRDRGADSLEGRAREHVQRPCPACGLQVRDLRRRDLREQTASPGIDQQGRPAALDRPGGPLCDPLPLERRPLSGHLHVRASARALRLPDLRCRSTSTIEAPGSRGSDFGRGREIRCGPRRRLPTNALKGLARAAHPVDASAWGLAFSPVRGADSRAAGPARGLRSPVPPMRRRHGRGRSSPCARGAGAGLPRRAQARVRSCLRAPRHRMGCTRVHRVAPRRRR